MKLAAYSDASYLSEPNAQSRAGGHCFLSNNAKIPANRGAILNSIAHIIKYVMPSAMEAELAALYIMARAAVQWSTKTCPTLVGQFSDLASVQGWNNSKILY